MKNSGVLKVFIGVFIGVAASALFLFIMKSQGYIKVYIEPEENVGIEAVNYMYTFYNLNNLAYNDKELEKITTEKAYKLMTATDVDKALNTYLKLKAKDSDEFASEVVVLENRQCDSFGYVVYTLKNDAITYGRRFMLFYDLTKDGKIKNPVEYEGYLFPNYAG